MKKEIIDGNTACAKASYKLSEMSFIYPITPSSPMAEYIDEMKAKNTKNIFGNLVEIAEMQSEGGAIGAIHGSALSGSVSTTFTSSQGLLLMIPNMYKIAGEMLPVVINVASRSVASHALNIFCDHSDVMSARQTGFAMLSASNPQEVYDFTVASFLTSIKTRVPFLNFFDGFRTSHQISNVTTFNDDELKKIYPFEKLKEYKSRAISPNSPRQYGTNEGQDIFFQGREKSNNIYNNLPQVLESTFDDIRALGGRKHHIFEYYGSKKAKFVIVVMASAFDTVKLFIDSQKNEDYGAIKVNLYRPFAREYFLNVIPQTVQKIAVLDRTKEQGSVGEPLFLDVSQCIFESDKNIKVVGGRFGLGGKEFNLAMAKSVFENLEKEKSKSHFTIGIDDDMSFSSLPFDKNFCIEDKSYDMLIFGLGSDGMVSCSKNITKIVGENTNKFVQAYFMYDSKKSGGITRSYLSFDSQQTYRPFLSTQNDLVVVSNISFLNKYNILDNLKQNGVLLINSPFDALCDIEEYLNKQTIDTLLSKNATIYSIDSSKIARENNLKGKISAIMQCAIFAVTNILDKNIAFQKTLESIKKSLAKKGEDVIEENLNAISNIEKQVAKITLKNSKKQDENFDERLNNELYKNYILPISNLCGDNIKVSQTNNFGENITGTSMLEKRNISQTLPKWNCQKCLQCGKCTFVCPHAVLRAKLLSDEQLKNAPSCLETKKSNIDKNSNFTLQISPEDCTGCGLCESVCPVKDKAIKLAPKTELFNIEMNNYKFTNELMSKIPLLPASPLSLQFAKPYFEFSGACAGCGETPYIKLLTQLFGSNLIVANATGCSSIYGGSAPTCPYTYDKNGQGPAWANSLFEDNAEFGYGIAKGERNKRENFKVFVETNLEKFNQNLKQILSNWISVFDNFAECEKIYLNLKAQKIDDEFSKIVKDNLNLITPKTVWLVGGDGWAYDIDFGGLDHIFASGENINILVLDTETYSNTGGQMSKSTPRCAIAKFCADGKKTSKKNLALSALNYKDIYVANVCLGANMSQLIKSMEEAQNYKGVSLIIAYCPCISHGIDMSKNIETEIGAVETGYFPLFRYNPTLAEIGKNPMQIDSETKNYSFTEYLLKERRFANFYEQHKNSSEELKKTQDDRKDFYDTLLMIKKSFEKND